MPFIMQVSHVQKKQRLACAENWSSILFLVPRERNGTLNTVSFSWSRASFSRIKSFSWTTSFSVWARRSNSSSGASSMLSASDSKACAWNNKMSVLKEKTTNSLQQSIHRVSSASLLNAAFCPLQAFHGACRNTQLEETRRKAQRTHKPIHKNKEYLADHHMNKSKTRGILTHYPLSQYQRAAQRWSLPQSPNHAELPFLLHTITSTLKSLSSP